jgi:hypothetical protein
LYRAVAPAARTLSCATPEASPRNWSARKQPWPRQAETNPSSAGLPKPAIASPISSNVAARCAVASTSITLGLDDHALQVLRVLGQTLDSISADNDGIHADAAASAAGITADPIGGSSVQAITVVDGTLAEATGATPQTFATVIVRRADLPQGIANDLARPLAAHLATRLP